MYLFLYLNLKHIRANEKLLIHFIYWIFLYFVSHCLEKTANEVLEEWSPISWLCEVACFVIVFVSHEFVKRKSIRNLVSILSKRTYLSRYANWHRLQYNVFSPRYKKELVAPYKIDKPVKKWQPVGCSLLNLLEFTGQEEILKQE